MVGAAVVFSFDKQDFPATTGSTGQATARARYPDSSRGAVPVKVDYAGDRTHQASRTTATVKRRD